MWLALIVPALACALEWDHPGDVDGYNVYCDGAAPYYTEQRWVACDHLQTGATAQCCVTAVKGGLQSPCSLSLRFVPHRLLTGCLTPRGLLHQSALGAESRQPCRPGHEQVQVMIR